LIPCKLPHEFWAEALFTAAYLRNLSPTKALEGTTTYEAWTNKKPSVNHLKIFGCEAFAHIPKDEREKLDSKARKCIFLGYGQKTKGYWFYDTNHLKVFYSRDVEFCENDEK